jgi:hypothetical protein
VEVPEDLVRVPGLGGGGPRAVELLRRVRHLLLEDGKHSRFFSSLGLLAAAATRVVVNSDNERATESEWDEEVHGPSLRFIDGRGRMHRE